VGKDRAELVFAQGCEEGQAKANVVCRRADDPECGSADCAGVEIPIHEDLQFLFLQAHRFAKRLDEIVEVRETPSINNDSVRQGNAKKQAFDGAEETQSNEGISEPDENGGCLELVVVLQDSIVVFPEIQLHGAR